MKRISVSVLKLAPVVLLLGAQRVSPLIVHEWGTITTRHAPNGAPLGRLNRIANAEVLPAFVHRFEPPAVDSQRTLLKSPVVPGRPDVTMRLETPVLYFHPAKGSAPLPPLDVSVRFRGGILNEFYPNGDASVALDAERISMKQQAATPLKQWDGDVLNNYVVGQLNWRAITLQETVHAPKTRSRVWLAPRAVRSTGVSMPSGEEERYLFYRGVAHLDALMQTELMEREVRLRAPQRLEWLRESSMKLKNVWLVDVRADGRTAFRERKDIVIERNGANADLARVPLFSEDDYSATVTAGLRSSMKAALLSSGLFEDEANAMLATWDESYFRTPGLRVFYIVPSEWTQYFLPLTISVPHELTRVLVGRIDLIRRQ